MSIGGPSAAFSRKIGFTSICNASTTLRPSCVTPDAWVPMTTGLPRRSAIARCGLSPRTMNMPGEEYIAAMTRSGVSGFASAPLAISPATSARSSLPASRSGTFSLEPLVFLGSTRMRGSCAFTTSANAAP
jgi:hypothetical protein